jgi:OmcA/MtrC family decaheme c-type cytochrome
MTHYKSTRHKSCFFDLTKLNIRDLIVFLFMLLGVLVLGACSDGDTGEAGASGETGIPGNPGADPSAVVASFESANIANDGTLTVDFSTVDEDGFAYPYLAGSQVRFTIAKLMAAGSRGAGESSAWQNYVNRIENAPTDPSDGPGTEDTIHATSESNGTFTNNADGSYRYVFNTNLKSVSSPLVVNYTADDTHRVAIQISGGGIPEANAYYDWQPSTGMTSGIVSRNMVSTDSCNSCHGELALHGGGRKEVQYCVTCHNPGSVDANSGNSVDFPIMIHKIHFGKELPSVKDGGEYAIWGYRDSKHNYSEVGFPQDPRNCRTCHDENNSLTPDADNWMMFPTAESCGSCHDDVNFETGVNHVSGARTNAECSTCHVGGENNQLRVDVVHNIAGFVDAKTLMALRVDGSSLDPTNNDAQLRFSLINPSDNSVYTQAASAMNFLGRARLYRNPVSSDTGYSDSFFYFDITSLTPDGAGLYTLDTDIVLASNEVLAFNTRMRVCTDPKNGGLLDCADQDAENAGVTPVWGNIDATGALVDSDDELATGADYERCETCHADPTIGVHGGDYSSLQQCRSCHNNSFLRDIGNLDLKFVIHAYHAGNLDDGAGGKESVHYPDSISNCSQCHSNDQLDLPILANKWAPETDTGVFTSSTAFVCASCHLKTQPGAIDIGNLSALPMADQALVGHMIQNGAIFNGSQAAANVTESCAVCHSSDSMAAIDSAHSKLD